MRSPLRLLALAAAVLVAAFGAASARASGADDARATAAAFLDALLKSDADRACSLFTPEAVDRLGGLARCKRAFAESENAQDEQALETLLRAYTAARRSAKKRHGHYLTRHFTKRALAREIERLDAEVTVKLGRGPQAAAGELVTTVVLDTRSSARRLVFYAESDDGSIFRLSVSGAGKPDLDEVAVGVPETTQPPPGPTVTTRIDSITVDPAGTAFVRATLTVTKDDESENYAVLLVLVPRNGGYLVDDFFYSVLSDPS